MKIQGVISDMDGVILDSEKLYVRFWCEAGRFYGFPMEEKHALSIRSMARPLASAKLKGIFGDGFDYEAVRSKRVELMDNYVEKNGIEVKSGAKELLSFLPNRAYTLALLHPAHPYAHNGYSCRHRDFCKIRRCHGHLLKRRSHRSQGKAVDLLFDTPA